MIVGVGVDVVELARFERATQRTPALLARLFAESEQVQDGQVVRADESKQENERKVRGQSGDADDHEGVVVLLRCTVNTGQGVFIWKQSES